MNTGTFGAGAVPMLLYMSEGARFEEKSLSGPGLVGSRSGVWGVCQVVPRVVVGTHTHTHTPSGASGVSVSVSVCVCVCTGVPVELVCRS